MKQSFAPIFFGIIFSSAQIAAPPPAQAALPDGVAGKYLSAQIAALRGHAGEAAHFIEQVWHDDNQNADVLHQLILFKVAIGKINDAIALARKLERLRENDSLVCVILGVEAMRREDYRTAIKYFNKFNQSQHRHFERWSSVPALKAWAFFGDGQIEKAMAVFEHEERTHPRMRALSAFQRALIYDQADKPSLARRAYEEAMKKYHGAFGRLIYIYSFFLERSGDKAGAKRIYKSLIGDGGANSAIGAAGLARLARGEKPEAIVTSVKQGAAEVCYYYSTLAILGNRINEALFYARLALFMRGSFDEAHLRLAKIFERQNDFDQVIEIYRRIDPESVYALMAGIEIAFAYEKMGKEDLAESQLFALARRHRRSTQPLTALGRIYRARHEFVKSADIYSKAIERAGDEVNWLLYYSRGIALERSGQWSRAEQDLRRALVLSDDNPDTLNYLGYAWVDRGYHLERALDMLERAARARPNSGHIIDSLGWAHYRLGRFSEAVQHLERAVRLRPSEPVINDHLGDALWRVGRRVEARYQWQRVLELAPVPEIDFKQVRRKIEEGLDQPKMRSETRL